MSPAISKACNCPKSTYPTGLWSVWKATGENEAAAVTDLKTNLALIPVAEMNSSHSAYLLDIQFYVIKTFISETRAISVKQ